jgi:geranylgeranyl diphosphate/geranylgeranyl-bacteriochlorophyllide a reductase
MEARQTYDVVVVGGGPAGATAAHDLSVAGHSVLLLDRAGRIKPCGGAIPPVAMREFDIPDHLLVARARGARIFAPSAKRVDMPIDNGFVGMVDRDVFDEWLRDRAADAGADRVEGTFETLSRDEDGTAVVQYASNKESGKSEKRTVRARSVVGADGALSHVARQAVPGAQRIPYVFAYHEIVRIPERVEGDAYDATRCDIYYQGRYSPDFYAWVFPHGDTASIGTGSANKGFSLRQAVGALRQETGLEETDTIRKEGAPIPLKPLKRWDNGRDVVLAGDAAGVVAPASGEGIYYAMTGGRLAADAVHEFLATGDARALATARKRFMKAHGRVFWILGMMQRFWYSSEWRRERFVTMCGDRDVQRLTWESYMNKKLTRKKPVAHVRIFFKDLAHLFRLISP